MAVLEPIFLCCCQGAECCTAVYHPFASSVSFFMSMHLCKRIDSLPVLLSLHRVLDINQVKRFKAALGFTRKFRFFEVMFQN